MAATKSATSLFFRLIALVVYILLGSLVFSYIELRKSSNEEVEELHLKIAHGISFLLRNLSCTFNLSETDLQVFTLQIMEMKRSRNESWQFQDGLRFSFELLTTIGYGTTPPTTQTGRLLCVFYALLGIPLFLLVLKGMGELLNQRITKAIETFEKKILRREQQTNIKGKVLYVFAAGMIIFILLVAVKMHAFPKYGNPTYIDSLYVLFITFATVGFGDITFVDSSVNVPVTLLGLTLVSTTINAISVWFEDTNRCIRCCKGSKTTNRTEVIQEPGVEETELKTKISRSTSADHTTVPQLDSICTESRRETSDLQCS